MSLFINYALRGIVFLLLGFQSFSQSTSFRSIQIPGREKLSQINAGEVAVLPSGRFVSPVGNVKRITHDPFGLAVSPNGQFVATLHNGVMSLYDIIEILSYVFPIMIKKYLHLFRKVL